MNIFQFLSEQNFISPTDTDARENPFLNDATLQSPKSNRLSFGSHQHNEHTSNLWSSILDDGTSSEDNFSTQSCPSGNQMPSVYSNAREITTDIINFEKMWEDSPHSNNQLDVNNMFSPLEVLSPSDNVFLLPTKHDEVEFTTEHEKKIQTQLEDGSKTITTTTTTTIPPSNPTSYSVTSTAQNNTNSIPSSTSIFPFNSSWVESQQRNFISNNWNLLDSKTKNYLSSILQTKTENTNFERPKMENINVHTQASLFNYMSQYFYKRMNFHLNHPSSTLHHPRKKRNFNQMNDETFLDDYQQCINKGHDDNTFQTPVCNEMDTFLSESDLETIPFNSGLTDLLSPVDTCGSSIVNSQSFNQHPPAVNVPSSIEPEKKKQKVIIPSTIPNPPLMNADMKKEFNIHTTENDKHTCGRNEIRQDDEKVDNNNDDDDDDDNDEDEGDEEDNDVDGELDQIMTTKIEPINPDEQNPNKKRFKIHITVIRVQKRDNPQDPSKPYVCDVCQKAFKDRSNLIKHIRTHTKEKPYKCKVCGSSFSHSQTLKEHSYIHTNVRPFTCSLKGCGKTFTSEANLKRHLRTHTGQKPYNCHLCTKSFSQSGNLKVHLRDVHTMNK